MCIKSVDFVRRLDKDQTILECVDFRNEDDPRLNLVDIDRSILTTTVHTRTPDGNIYACPEAILRAVNAIGKRHCASWTALPVIRPLFNYCYWVFARNRLQFFATRACKDGTCNINH